MVSENSRVRRFDSEMHERDVPIALRDIIVWRGGRNLVQRDFCGRMAAIDNRRHEQNLPRFRVLQEMLRSAKDVDVVGDYVEVSVHLKWMSWEV
jgi:hypothetical protein